jgi:hypoxanthine phosphoribosyltransferase
MNKPLELEPLFSETRIRERTEELVREIAGDFQSSELVLIGLLKGSFMFMADLARQFSRNKIELVIDFMSVSSYGSGTHSSGNIRMARDVTTDISGRPVLVVDDILDTGLTLEYVSTHLTEKKPSLLKTCVLLDKPTRHRVSIKADYVGFTVPDRFVVGYGLDYDNRFRELPWIAAVHFQT